MKNTLLAVSAMLAVVSVGSVAMADDSASNGVDNLNFQTEVGASAGSLFGDSAKEENRISRKSKMDENLFIQSTDANSGFGVRIGYTHFGDLDATEYKEVKEAIHKWKNEINIDKGLIFADKQAIISAENNPEAKRIYEARLAADNSRLANAKGAYHGLVSGEKVVKTITSTLDLEVAKKFKVAPKITITALAGAAYANYTEYSRSEEAQKEHVFLPEAGVEAGYDITDNVMATVGYNHIFSLNDIKAVDTANVGLAVKFS